MKAAPVMRALETWPDARQTLVHTGQHYDRNLSDIFFSQLNMPAPDVNLEVGSGSHAVQTAEVMKRLEPVVLERKPDVVLVYGDVNSTVAATLVCSKLRIRVGHVEAGLRSFDRTMPEEINRIVTDQLADLLFTPAEDSDVNLRREGFPAEKIYRVGNVMIDSLIQLLPAVKRFSKNGLPQRYALVTLHRPSNVDDSANLKNILQSEAESFASWWCAPGVNGYGDRTLTLLFRGFCFAPNVFVHNLQHDSHVPDAAGFQTQSAVCLAP